LKFKKGNTFSTCLKKKGIGRSLTSFFQIESYICVRVRCGILMSLCFWNAKVFKNTKVLETFVFWVKELGLVLRIQKF
jgi:hypothetical protein